MIHWRDNAKELSYVWGPRITQKAPSQMSEDLYLTLAIFGLSYLMVNIILYCFSLCVSFSLCAEGLMRPITLFTCVVLFLCILFSFFGLCLKKLQPRKPSSYQVGNKQRMLPVPCERYVVHLMLASANSENQIECWFLHYFKEMHMHCTDQGNSLNSSLKFCSTFKTDMHVIFFWKGWHKTGKV